MALQASEAREMRVIDSEPHLRSPHGGSAPAYIIAEDFPNVKY